MNMKGHNYSMLYIVYMVILCTAVLSVLPLAVSQSTSGDQLSNTDNIYANTSAVIPLALQGLSDPQISWVNDTERGDAIWYTFSGVPSGQMIDVNVHSSSTNDYFIMELYNDSWALVDSVDAESSGIYTGMAILQYITPSAGTYHLKVYNYMPYRGKTNVSVSCYLPYTIDTDNVKYTFNNVERGNATWYTFSNISQGQFIDANIYSGSNYDYFVAYLYNESWGLVKSVDAQSGGINTGRAVMQYVVPEEGTYHLKVYNYAPYTGRTNISVSSLIPYTINADNVKHTFNAVERGNATWYTFNNISAGELIDTNIYSGSNNDYFTAYLYNESGGLVKTVDAQSGGIYTGRTVLQYIVPSGGTYRLKVYNYAPYAAKTNISISTYPSCIPVTDYSSTMAPNVSRGDAVWTTFPRISPGTLIDVNVYAGSNNDYFIVYLYNESWGLVKSLDAESGGIYTGRVAFQYMAQAGGTYHLKVYGYAPYAGKTSVSISSYLPYTVDTNNSTAIWSNVVLGDARWYDVNVNTMKTLIDANVYSTSNYDYFIVYLYDQNYVLVNSVDAQSGGIDTGRAVLQYIAPSAGTYHIKVYGQQPYSSSTNITLSCFVMPYQSSNLWNIQVNSDDRFHSNEAWLRPWRYNYDDGVGQWQGGYSYEVPWYYGPYNQSLGAVGNLRWVSDGNGNLSVQTSSNDYQWHAWTYVYVDQPTTITLPCQGDCVPMVFLNYDFDHPIDPSTHGWSVTLNLLAGENRIDITGYNQNDVYNFNFGGSIATQVGKISSGQLPTAITVGPSGYRFTSIQAAVDSATAGDTILVYSGTYKENVNVYKALTLRGVDDGGGLPVVEGANGSGDNKPPAVFSLSASNIYLENFNITNGIGNDGISISKDYVTVRNNKISNFYHGIWAFGNYDLITLNDVRDCGWDGIALSGVNGTTVSSNSVNNCTFGIDANHCEYCNIDDNVVSNSSKPGIWLYETNLTSVTDNYASYCDNGIGSLGFNCNNVFTNNTLMYNHVGVWIHSNVSNPLSTPTDNVFRNNTMAHNARNFGDWEDWGIACNDVDMSNTVDGKPIVYLANVSGVVIAI